MVQKLEGWEYLETGTVKVLPLTGAQAIPLTSGTVALQLRYLETPEHAAAFQAGQRPATALQLGVHLEQIETLATILTQAADALRRQLSQDGKPN